MEQYLEPLFAELAAEGHGAWVDQLKASNADLLDPAKNGHMKKWSQAIRDLPARVATRMCFDRTVVSFDGDQTDHSQTDEEQQIIRNSLQQFHPWRKGPFELFGVNVDAEWRSDRKWARVAPHVDVVGKRILDIGCGNGYYGWRMIGAGADRVIGLEPYPLYNMQHAIFRNHARHVANDVIAASDTSIGPEASSLFDVVFSMGVFYHCRNPVGHLDAIRRTLRADGRLVLETLVIDGGVDSVLVPEDRYAKMRNVWLIPSPLFLERLLRRTGFTDVAIVDITETTTDEQRSTDWMRFESLADFLDPDDPTRTAEGHPPPTRAIVLARKR